jgi:hypothetical protein
LLQRISQDDDDDDDVCGVVQNAGLEK